MLFFALLPVAIWLANRFVSSAASDPHLSRAASGASDAPCMPQWVAISENDMKKLQTESADWKAYRSEYPFRPIYGRLNFTRRRKPGKPDQRAWHVYESWTPGRRQQWVMVPTLIPVSQLTEPLAVAPSEAELFACELPPQGLHEHWTNIHRIRSLAEKHPQIQVVREHNKHKSLDPSRFDPYGRAESYHQSPFDLAIGLAASGAEMYVGVSDSSGPLRKKLRTRNQSVYIHWLRVYCCLWSVILFHHDHHLHDHDHHHDLLHHHHRYYHSASGGTFC